MELLTIDSVRCLSTAGGVVCREVAGKAYCVWADWAASALAADLSSALQADAALSSNVVLRSWEEVVVADTLPQACAAYERSSLNCTLPIFSTSLVPSAGPVQH